MTKTAMGLIEHCKNALQDKVKYVYGAKMQRLTLAQIKALRANYGARLVWPSDDLKAGHMCCDCSGLISSYTGIERSSQNYKDTASEVLSLSVLKQNWNKYIGYGLWMQGHIGVVSEKNGYYYAMDGSARNMVCNPLSMQEWTKVIKLKDIDYSEEVVDMEELKKLQEAYTELEERVRKLEGAQDKVYKSFDDVPLWGRNAVMKVIDAGALQGDGTGLNLTHTMLRNLVIEDKMREYNN